MILRAQPAISINHRNEDSGGTSYRRQFVSENGCACNRTTTRSVREKVGFGFDANSWKIAKVKKIFVADFFSNCGKFCCEFV